MRGVRAKCIPLMIPFSTPVENYGLYSLRSSGVTSVVSNDISKTVSERLFVLKLHGHWKTNEAKDMYACSGARM